MNITPQIFEARLKCPTKCWLRFAGESTAGHDYADWVKATNETYRTDTTRQLTANLNADECANAPAAETLKTAQWYLAVDVPVHLELRSSRCRERELQPRGG